MDVKPDYLYWVQQVFKWTYDGLVSVSELTGYTYTEINVLVWYFVIPATWAVLLDRIFGSSYFKLTYATIAVKILSSVDFPTFANWLFEKSARFLNSFRGLGGDYVTMSVIVCVLIPLAVYAILLWFAFVKSWFCFLSAKETEGSSSNRRHL